APRADRPAACCSRRDATLIMETASVPPDSAGQLDDILRGAMAEAVPPLITECARLSPARIAAAVARTGTRLTEAAAAPPSRPRDQLHASLAGMLAALAALNPAGIEWLGIHWCAAAPAGTAVTIPAAAACPHPVTCSHPAVLEPDAAQS